MKRRNLNIKSSILLTAVTKSFLKEKSPIEYCAPKERN